MNEQERKLALQERKRSGYPWHAVPFIDSGPASYMITAACYEHRAHIGLSIERMNEFSSDLRGEISQMEGLDELIAWVVLPNHYHFLCHASDIGSCKRDLGKLHGRTSHRWNSEERTRGRTAWFKAAETVMKSERHYWATVNYIHHNPVKHGCVRTQDQWRWSSFPEWNAGVGRDSLADLWKKFPIKDYGRDWDEDDLSDSVPLE